MSILNLLPLIVALGGGYMLVKLRFFFILHPIKTVRKVASVLRAPSARTSLFLALAGTLGVGNIVGVAVGISVGGAGSVFWLLVSSVFASVLKFSESTLSADSAMENGGGMMIVLKNNFKKIGKLLGIIYAVLCILLSFSMGAALQTSSVVSSLDSSLGMHGISVVILFSVLVLAVILRRKKIKKVTGIVIPITTLVYVVLALSAVGANLSRIPSVFSDILSSAFSLDAARGGAVGFFTSTVVREGFARGLLSNEAGAGTSSLANSECLGMPTSSGLLGMCEVFFDTVILCTLTALAILTSVDNPSAFSSGIELVLLSVGNTFGAVSRVLVSACIALFAYATVICWYYYGDKCIRFLFGRGYPLYTLLFIAAVFSGAFVREWVLVLVSDYILLFLTFLTFLAIIKSSDRIKALSEHSGLLPFGRYSK